MFVIEVTGSIAAVGIAASGLYLRWAVKPVRAAYEFGRTVQAVTARDNTRVLIRVLERVIE